MDDKRSSAYNAFSNVNKGLEQRRRIPSLAVDVPYLITKVTAMPVHHEYGQGHQVHLRDKDKKIFFVILPNRIAAKVGADNFDQFNEDIKARKPPFLIFKGMEGNAFNVAIKQFSLELAQLAVRGEVFTEGPVVEAQDEFDWLDDLAAGSSGTSSNVEPSGKRAVETSSPVVPIDEPDEPEKKKVKVESS